MIACNDCAVEYDEEHVANVGGKCSNCGAQIVPVETVTAPADEPPPETVTDQAPARASGLIL